MLLASKNHTVGNATRWTVDYKDWLNEGRWLTAATVTSPSATLTITGTVILEGKQVIFFTNGGVLSEAPVVTVRVTDSDGQIANDTIQFTVVAP